MEKIKKEYTFGEKKQEYSTKKKEQVDVWVSPKYLETKKFYWLNGEKPTKNTCWDSFKKNTCYDVVSITGFDSSLPA